MNISNDITNIGRFVRAEIKNPFYNTGLRLLKSRAKKVLLVEDNPMIQFLHKEMLLNINCDVDVVNDAETALSFLENKYDLILLDIGLPGMSGIQLAKKIRQGNTVNKKVKIYAVTAHVLENIIEECKIAGINKVISKPVSFEMLKTTIYI